MSVMLVIWKSVCPLVSLANLFRGFALCRSVGDWVSPGTPGNNRSAFLGHWVVVKALGEVGMNPSMVFA